MRGIPTPETSEVRHREPSFLDLLSGWMQQGIGSFFATQRILLDLVMRQNATAMHVARERITDTATSPISMLTEMAAGGMSNFVEAQKVLLNLAHQQNKIVSTGVRDRVGGSTAGAVMTDTVARTVETFIDMQQGYLRIISNQMNAWLHAAKTGTVYNPDVVEVARNAMETFINSQKRFLDVIAEETAAATSGRPPAAPGKKTELSDLARQATDALIDAQKKLFDLAGDQMHINIKAASRAFDMFKPSALLPWAEITREGVKSFVDAEKALIDVFFRPARPVHPEAEARTERGPRPIPYPIPTTPPARKPRRRRRVTKAKAAAV